LRSQRRPAFQPESAQPRRFGGGKQDNAPITAEHGRIVPRSGGQFVAKSQQNPMVLLAIPIYAIRAI
jgi:hypothetical protein